MSHFREGCCGLCRDVERTRGTVLSMLKYVSTPSWDVKPVRPQSSSTTATCESVGSVRVRRTEDQTDTVEGYLPLYRRKRHYSPLPLQEGRYVPNPVAPLSRSPYPKTKNECLRSCLKHRDRLPQRLVSGYITRPSGIFRTRNQRKQGPRKGQHTM